MDKEQIKLCLQRGILLQWHDLEYQDYDNDVNALKKVKEYEAKHKNAKNEGVGLYLHGKPGTGKTMLMNVLFKHLLLKHKETARVIQLETLIHKYLNYREAEDGFNDVVKKCNFLAIEGMGKEYKSGSNDLALLVMDLVFQYRSQMYMPTCITTTVDPSNIKNIYNSELASLFMGCLLVVNVKGEDRRVSTYDERQAKYFR